MGEKAANAQSNGGLASLFGDPPIEARHESSPPQNAEQAQPLDYKVAIRGLAALTGGDADAILADYEGGGPLADAIAHFLGVETAKGSSGKSRGRPIDMQRDFTIYSVVTSLMLDDKLRRSDAIEEARHKLFKQGVRGKGKPQGPLSGRAIERAMLRSHRLWLDPPEK